jgi:NitT/TauT family transport system ATP-binding protein
MSHGVSPRPAPGDAPAAAHDTARGRLELRGISKQFGTGEVLALDHVDLDVRPGEFVVVVGPSGCGKSTLLAIAGGMLAPSGGTVSVDGRPVRSPGPDRTMVFQEPALFPWLTALDNVAFGLRMVGVPRAEREERARAALKSVHLIQAAAKLPHELSGGMRQRVAIARALVMDPAVLLMDEPFSALDAQTRTLLHGQLQELWCASPKTVLFVTHSVGEAVRLADRIIVLHTRPGRIRREVAVGLPHPRDFDSPAMAAVVGLVRDEIVAEVNRVNAELADDVA